MGERNLVRKRITLLLTALMMALTMSFSGVAFAKISPPSCKNNGGQEPRGQQDKCNGGGLTKTPALNPAGHAPGGHNK
jgi:hypothetical protein